MKRDSKNIVVLTADIAESTHLYDRMGDVAATNMTKKCLSLIQEIAKGHMGDVINTAGDKVNCIFWDADSAVLAAKEMNEAIENHIINDTDDRMPINLHIGIHSGPVQNEGDEIFGDTVYMVDRVTDIAKPRQILITEQVFNNLESSLRQSALQSTTIAVKGKSSPLNLYEYIWEDFDMTVEIDRDKLSEFKTAQSKCLELTFQDHTYEITYHAPRLKLGRQSLNDLIIRDKSVSRFHARIELRNDKFVLIDNSLNGTYVNPQEANPYCLKWKESNLEGAGVIGLGEDSRLDPKVAIHYCINNAD